MEPDRLSSLLQSQALPYFVALVLTVIGGVVGKPGVTVSLCLVAWVLTIYSLRAYSVPVWIGLSMIVGGCLVLFAYWARPGVIPAYFGILRPAETAFSWKSPSSSRMLEIGDSGAKLLFAGPEGVPLFKFFEDSELMIESVEIPWLCRFLNHGRRWRLGVSTKVRDRNGKLVAELIRNEWKVAPPPGTWDRNYTHDALEVLDPAGKVVLQVNLLPDRIQLQGEWWGDAINGVRLVKNNDPAHPGALIMIFGPNSRLPKSPEIVPMFIYPSDLHFGELAKR